MNESESPESIAAAAQQRLEARRKDLGITERKADEETAFAAEIGKRLSAIKSIPIDPVKQQIRIQADRDRRSLDVFSHAGCPKRHSDFASDIDRTGAWGETEKTIASRMGSGFLIALVGGRGTGKTQLAVELIRKLSHDLRRSRFCTAMQFLMEIKAGYRQDSASEKDIIATFCRPALLVLDEMGKRAETEWESRLLFELINQRYNAMRDTLIISNQEAAELEAALGPSIVSRMRETGGFIECNWESYRK